MGCLYQLTFPNGKSYIGISASTAAARFTEHCSDSRNQRQANRLVCRAIRKFGASVVIVETIAIESDWDALCLMECVAIKERGTKHPSGYNLTDGGEGTLGFVPSEETKLKVRISLLGNKRKLGKKESQETCALKSRVQKKRWKKETSANRERRLSPMRAFGSCPKRAAKISRTKLGTYCGGASGSVGVQLSKGRWRARVKYEQRCIHLGYFNNIEDAILARLKWQQTMEEQGAREWTQSNCAS